MQRSFRIALLASILAGATYGLTSADRPDAARAADTAPDRAAVERTRDIVKMLDDLYKGYVVHITATYVADKDKQAAAVVTKKVFKHMADKGWHKARLVDATGKPINPANAVKTDFEKKAIAAIKGGKPYVDEVGQTDGKPVLRAATIVPVVMSQCISCHPGHKQGDLLGAIVYEVPIR